MNGCVHDDGGDLHYIIIYIGEYTAKNSIIYT